MGWLEIAGAVGAGAVCGSVAGSLAGYYAGWAFKTQLDMLERKVNGIWGSVNSAKGVNAREAITMEKIEMAGKIATILKQKGEPKEKLEQVFAVASEHPEMTLKMLEKAGVM